MGLLDFLFEKDEAEEVAVEEELPLKVVKNKPISKLDQQVVAEPLVEKSVVVKERAKHINVDEFEPKATRVKPIEKPKQVYQFSPSISPIFGVVNDKKVDATKQNAAVFIQKPVISKSKLGTVLSPYYGEGFDVIKSQDKVDTQSDITIENVTESCPVASYELEIEMSSKHEIDHESFGSNVNETFAFGLDDPLDDHSVVGNFDHLTLDDILVDEKLEGTKRVVSVENISLFDGDN